MEMEIFEDKMENVSGLNLTNIHREIIEEIKNQEEGIEIEIPHEYFDENYRGELWAKSVRMVEIRDKEESMSKLREIINVDKVKLPKLLRGAALVFAPYLPCHCFIQLLFSLLLFLLK